MHLVVFYWRNKLRLSLDYVFGVRRLRFSFFFCTCLWDCSYCSCTVQWTVAAKFDFSIFFSQSVHIGYCSWTHKFHFSATFSLKMGPTVLFTHLKIILLQYFSVFSFSFHFSAVSKQTLHSLFSVYVMSLTSHSQIFNATRGCLTNKTIFYTSTWVTKLIWNVKIVSFILCCIYF